MLSEKDWLSGAMQTAESRVGEGSDSPTARACKTGMQKLRGLFIKGSKGRLRGDGNDEEAMAGKRGTLEYNEEEEAMEEISTVYVALTNFRSAGDQSQRLQALW